MTTTNGSAQVDGALVRFGETRENARKFHRRAIGDVDPNYCWSDWLFQVGKARGLSTSTEKYAAHKKLEEHYGSLTGVEKATLTATGSGQVGGYLVPPQLLVDLMRDMSEEAFVRPEALVLPMDSQTLMLPLPDVQTVTGTAGIPPFFGGIQLKWTAESTTLNETAEPQFRQVELRANELTGYALVSNPMMMDAMGLDAWLRRLFARSAAWFEDYAFLRGSGVGQPMGMQTSGAAIAITRSTASPGGITGLHVQYIDLVTMLQSLLPYSYLHASWYVTVGATIQLLQLIDQSGKTAWVPNYPVNLDGDGKKGTRSTGRLFGREMYVTEKLPVFNTKGDIMIADPSLYVIGDRQSIDIDVSVHEPTAFKKYQTVWRIVHRVDGRPWVDGKITLGDQATVVSPIVILN